MVHKMFIAEAINMYKLTILNEDGEVQCEEYHTDFPGSVTDEMSRALEACAQFEFFFI